MSKTPLRIIAAQLNYTVGDIDGNRQKILDVIEREGNACDLLVFSELALTGYYPYDFLDRPEFITAQEISFCEVMQATKGIKAAVAIGHIGYNDGAGKPLTNAVSILLDGQVVHTTLKQLLPTYNVFHERRHFEPGGPATPFVLNGVKVGVLVCEDIWNDDSDDYAVNPVASLVGQGAELLVSVNASPSNLGKIAQRQRLVEAITFRYGVPVIYANQVGATDDIVFDGASFARSLGGLVAQAPAFEEATIALTFTDGALVGEGDIADLGCLYEPAAFMYAQAVLGLRDYVRKCRQPGIVVGSSGGIDSAVTLAVGVDALGPGGVAAVTMPSTYSSEGSVSDSVRLCNNLGISLIHASIADEFELAVAKFKEVYGMPPSRLTYENMQARIRGRKLMEHSNEFGQLVVSTGNKSELSVGYCTLYGDTNGGINILGDAYKMEVYALAEYINRRHGREVIPLAIIEKAPSAELSPGQKDEDSLPPYPVLDAILKLYIEGDLLADGEKSRCLLLAGQVSDEERRRVLRLVDNAEFKRRQAPPIIRMHPRAFGDGRRLPVAHGYRPA